MYCVIKCIVCGKQAHVKSADLLHPSCTVVMYRRKSVSPIHNVLSCSTGIGGDNSVQFRSCLCANSTAQWPVMASVLNTQVQCSLKLCFLCIH